MAPFKVRSACACAKGQHDVLGAEVVIAEPERCTQRQLEDVPGLVPQRRVAAVHSLPAVVAHLPGLLPYRLQMNSGAGTPAARGVSYQHNGQMVHVVILHSVYGLRQVELAAAERLRAAGHDVVTPDLYEGQTAENLDSGLTLMDAIGWEHGIAPIPASVRPGLPVQVHVAGADPFAPEPAVAPVARRRCRRRPGGGGVIYPGAGHF
jgi:hypothetical protein